MSEEQVAEVSESAEVAQSVEDWRDTIPEEIRSHKSLQHIADVGALAKSYVHAQSMIGADKIAIPGKSATAEEWAEVHTKLGRPESPDSYSIETSDDMNTDMVGWFKNTAHQLGLNQSQAETLFNSYNDFVGQYSQLNESDAEAIVQQTEQSLRAEWGQAFDDRVAQGFGVVNTFADESILETQLSDGSLLGDNADFIRLMASVGDFMQQKLGEDTLEGVKTSGAITPDQAQEKLNELRRKDSPFWDSRHPEHDFYVQQALKYQEMIHD